MSEDAEIESIRTDFTLLYIGDLARGAPKSAAEYYQLYPGYEDLIASELRRLGGGFARDENPMAPTGEPPAPRAGRAFTLGKYRVDRELGRGGQGTVYLAWDTALERAVALKVLKAAWTGSDALVRRFELEARALARLDPQGLAAIYDVGEVRGLRYIAMRHVEGRTLAQELADPARVIPDAAGIARYVALAEKAARALHEAHEAGLVHRDVKPGNLMITQEDEPVLLDFGVARLSERQGASMTLTGDVIGTPAFMAPEQLTAVKGPVDRRADVYALAATLHEALTIDTTARESSPVTMPLAAAFRPRAPAPQLNPRVPADLDAVLRAALDPDRDHRYATAAALADDLERVRRGLPVAVRARSRLSRLWLWCRRAPAAAALLFLTPTALTCGLVALSVKNREVAQAATALEEKQREADRAALLAETRFAELQRLDDLERVRDLEERERDLWPPGPDTQSAMERWIADATALAKRLPEHRAALDSLRRRGRIAGRQEPGADPVMDEKLHVAKFRDAAKAEAATLAAGHWRHAALEEFIGDADKKIEAIDRERAARPRYEFDGVEDQWAHDNLENLVGRLEALTAPGGIEGSIASVEHRLERARSLAAVSLTGASAAWDDAVRAIANPASDPAYAGLRIEPVLGLVPIGRDPRSRLWEFAVTLSGTPPARDAAGRLVVSEDSAIVLVLIPGGTVRMGARMPESDDEDGTDWVDSMAKRGESPVQDVGLDPFFISKFEMTQAQWTRATGRNPSFHHPDRFWNAGYRPDFRCPVEQVSWEDCEETLRRLGLVLPTEAQWECAARAGTSTPWWYGRTADSLLRDENLADRTSFKAELGVRDPGIERDDGWGGTAPVGTFPPNAWGVHDVVGNVSEWCADEAALYGAEPLPGDGLRCPPAEGARVVRGGAYNLLPVDARSSSRVGRVPTHREATIGVRPARPLHAP